ncbi:MAG: addiction module protein [Bacteroidales bacterium]|nr:addiction module protein [Bacteroidales bacterium]
MSTSEKKEFLREHLDSIDEKFLNTFYELMLFQLESQGDNINFTSEQKKELELRMQNHEKGASKSYSWDEVKTSIGR